MNYNNRLYANTKKSTRWSQASGQEREFYLGYQPKQNKRASVLMGNRLLIGKYTGNLLSAIPRQHLQELIDTFQINNPDDKRYIQAYLQATQ
jgi:hypothetical protein